MQLLLKGHEGVVLTAEDLARLVTWMDANALCYGTFDPADQTTRTQAYRVPSMATGVQTTDRTISPIGPIGPISPIGLHPRYSNSCRISSRKASSCFSCSGLKAPCVCP